MVEDKPAIFENIGKPMVAASDEEAEIINRSLGTFAWMRSTRYTMAVRNLVVII